MVAAKSDAAHLGLSRQFAAHSIERLYHSFVRGLPGADSGRVDRPIGRHPRDRKRMSVASRAGRESVTNWRVLRRYPSATVSELEIRPETGRTHQIRVHLSSIGLPLVGDQIYGRARGPAARLGRPALHARRLGFEHPISGARHSFETALPEDLGELARSLAAGEPTETVGPVGDIDQ
jgi:23S rRNA pseudouridine1911/1915/1917 synthase